VTETERHPTSRALVASFLFTDLVGFSKGTAAEQYAAKTTLGSILRSNLAALRAVDYRVKDTGDGALIAFVSNPEHALYMALAIGQDFERAARDAGFPSNALRTGLHLGSVKEAVDLEARPDFIGDGINAAKRIMDFASPGQITASRAFFDAVASLDSAYADLFRHVGAADDKHGRAHELYALSPSATVLEKLKLDLTENAPEPAKPPRERPPPAVAKRVPPAAAVVNDQATPGPAGRSARRWLLPLIAVIGLGVASLFVVTKMMQPSGSRNPQPAREAASSAPATTPMVAPSPAQGAVANPPTATPESAKPEISATHEPLRADAVPPPDSAQPAAAPAAGASKTTVKPRAKVETIPLPSASSDATADAGSLRCSRIMEKATLGEALSEKEKRELATCR